ncbi:DUF255 domain-containing protein [Thermodesulfovibrio sp.]|jgi:uncharacterized protein YyaL (SSP411 family)|uniref:thioredoxin domain-containing protein n=1 Tax=Thermodesulfovibrio TaxID=28261 RepID=UPI00263002A2|nr:DUF255 domain-containing protein [Thermodesulfovibrio sp.]
MIEWLPYSKESFKRAERENKPVFLHIYASWSNYCKKMREKILSNPLIAEKINKNFIPVLVNRDNRPDIDAIYQKASYIIGQGSGWPLNLILGHDGKPFAGISYKDSEGIDYFETMIDKALELFNTNRDKIAERAQVIVDAIKPIEIAPAEIREELIHNPEEDIVVEMDFENGGFKKTPKFPPFAHIDLLIWKYWIKPKPWILNALDKTLMGMISGGIYDHVEGGFHRYCVDREWKIPHFEKLAVDNSWHIINYLYAYSILKEEVYLEIVTETIDYMKKNLLFEDGFFCSSQSADEIYYTWQEGELRKISDMTIALVDGKAMVNDRFILIGRDREIIRQLRERLIMERQKRTMPDIDATLYAFVNGISSEAFILAWRKLNDRELLKIALKAINITLDNLLIDRNFYRTKGKTPALIDDYAYFISALISAYEVTSEKSYLTNAMELTDLALQNLWDSKNGGFYDSPEEIISIRQKSIHDTPYPSANSIMIINLLRLHSITREEQLLNFAINALKAFSNTVSAYLSPYYVKALLTYFDLLTLNFYTSLESKIAKATLHKLVPFTVIAHRENNGDYIIPSVGNKQFEPIKEADELEKFFKL